MKLLLCNSLGLVLQLLLVSVAQLQSSFGLLLFQVSQRCKGVLNQRLATLATHGGKLGSAAASLAGYQPIKFQVGSPLLDFGTRRQLLAGVPKPELCCCCCCGK